jgi:hypothetical protein
MSNSPAGTRMNSIPIELLIELLGEFLIKLLGEFLIERLFEFPIELSTKSIDKRCSIPSEFLKSPDKILFEINFLTTPTEISKDILMHYFLFVFLLLLYKVS